MLAQETQEFREIYDAFRQCIRLRQKYMSLSLQRPGDNPKDWPESRIWPLSPIPEVKERKHNNHRAYYEKTHKENHGSHFDDLRWEYLEGIPYDKIDIPSAHEVSLSIWLGKEQSLTWQGNSINLRSVAMASIVFTLQRRI